MGNIIEDRMLQLRDDSQVEGLSRFFKTGKGQYGEGDLFLGIKVPVTRSVVKEIWRTCDFDVLETSIASPWHEVRLCSLLVLVQIYKHTRKDKEMQRRCVDFYLSHTSHINNWDLVDLSCYEILGDWLLDKDRSILYELAGNGRTIWEQRIGTVSCMQFIRHGDCSDAIAIADILLHHPHDLIHKATGWMLREVGKRDEDLLRLYLDSPAPGETLPRCAVMPRTMLRYAIEKLPGSDKRKFMAHMIFKTSHFRDLTVDELYGILQLRAEVFVVGQNCNYQDLDNRDKVSYHVWAVDNGETVGCLRVFMYNDKYAQIGRVATSQKVRGKGWGLEMMKVGIQVVKEHFGNAPILIHAQSYATGFYEKVGFRISSEQFLEDGIPHHEMIRE